MIFWRQNDRGDFVISRGLLTTFLAVNGFGTFSDSDNRTQHGSLIKVDGNVLKTHDLNSIRKWVQRWIVGNLTNGEQDEVLDAFYRFRNFKDDLSTVLPVYSSSELEGSIPISFADDSSNVCRIPFRNGVVEITPETIELKSMDVLEEHGHVWETQIKKHHINPDTLGEYDGEGDFPNFVKRAMVVGDELVYDDNYTERLSSLETSIGYLIHRFNDPSRAKAVIFVDKDSQQGRAEGGNGKSVIAEGLNHLVPTFTVDGYKTGNLMGSKEGKFVFSGFIMGTRILILDDCSEKLKFESLFKNITGPLDIEKKKENIFSIPFSKKPKFLITTNHVLPKMSSSHARRQHIVEFGNYWNLMLQKGTEPVEVYNRRFFGDDWDNTQWDNFYNYFFKCIQSYLKHGLLQSSLVTYKQRQVKSAIEGNQDIGFVEWMDEWVKGKRLQGNYHQLPGISFDTLYFMASEDLPDLPKLDWFKDAVWRYCLERKYEFNKHKASKGNSRSARRYRHGGVNGKNQVEHLVITTNDDIELDKVA